MVPAIGPEVSLQTEPTLPGAAAVSAAAALGEAPEAAALEGAAALDAPATAAAEAADGAPAAPPEELTGVAEFAGDAPGVPVVGAAATMVPLLPAPSSHGVFNGACVGA